MRCVQAGNMCEKYSEYAQICANNERKYEEICGKYAHIVGICGKICDMHIWPKWPKYVDPKSVRRIVGIGTCTRVP